MKNLYRSAYALILALGVFTVSPVFGEEYQCEIMTVSGSATSGGKMLKEGDLLKKGDTIKVEADSYVDVAFDKEWNNITRLNEKSEVTIKEVYPTGLKMVEGGIFAKLHKLPKGTTFEIQTPTAVAAVRGSEYFTEHREGVTQVFNYSPSPVEVFSFDKSGGLMDRTVVQEAEKTEVRAVDEPPLPPAKMSADEMKRTTEMSGGIDTNIKEVKFEGRAGQAPDVKVVEQYLATTMPYMQPLAGAPAETAPDTTGGSDSGPVDSAMPATDTESDPNAPKTDDQRTYMGGPDTGGPGSGPGGPDTANMGGFDGPNQFTGTAPVMPPPPPMVDQFNTFTNYAPAVNDVLRTTESSTMMQPPLTTVTGGATTGSFVDPNLFNPPPGVTFYYSSTGQRICKDQLGHEFPC